MKFGKTRSGLFIFVYTLRNYRNGSASGLAAGFQVAAHGSIKIAVLKASGGGRRQVGLEALRGGRGLC